MKQLNRYYRHAKISERKTRRIIKYFALDLTADKTAQICGLTHKSIKQIYLKIRRRIAQECERASPFSSCEIEVDESYFGARRVRGKRGRGAGSKTIVFGIYKRNGCVFTEIVPNAAKKTLQAIIRGRVALDAVIHSDCWRGYNGLVDVGYSKASANQSFGRCVCHRRCSHQRHRKLHGCLPNAVCKSSTAYRLQLSICI